MLQIPSPAPDRIAGLGKITDVFLFVISALQVKLALPRLLKKDGLERACTLYLHIMPTYLGT
jgi:hypothetical protein